jgi:hypothetical protein
MMKQDEFGQRQQTPMQVLSPHLKGFMALPHINKVNLNRQSYQFNCWGLDESNLRKPITFDCIYLYRFVNAGASFSFSFNFKNVEAHTVRATVKMSKDGGVEYSREFSVSEAKELLKAFFVDHDEQALKSFQFAKVEEFLKLFANHFNITLSGSLKPAEAKAMKTEIVTKILGLNAQMKAKQEQVNALIKDRKYSSDADKQKLKSIHHEARAISKDLYFMLNEGMKGVPQAVREAVFKEVKIKQI